MAIQIATGNLLNTQISSLVNTPAVQLRLDVLFDNYARKAAVYSNLDFLN